MGFRNESDSEATFNRLRQIVEGASTRPSGPRVPAPRLHRLSPDIAYIHRHEVAAHQAAIREGRYSPVLEHQARGSTSIDVIGYTYNPARRDSTSTALYSEGSIPGEYLPPTPHEIMSPRGVRSLFRRQPISLAPVSRPGLMWRLDQPPFVPALPPGTVVLPVAMWGRSTSAPENWESALRHSAVYRVRGSDNAPRVPSPLHEQHGAESLAAESDESSWSHGTMPFDEGEGGRTRKVNGVSKKPNIRGGGYEEDWLGNPAWRESMLDQHWDGFNECRETSPGEAGLEETRHDDGYFTGSLLYEGYKLDACMHPTTEMPRLRGGGKPDHGPNRIPASLFYLAGATGRRPGQSITVDEWNGMKPKKRMGGLLGMAVFGNKGGKPYIPETRDQEVQTVPEPEPEPATSADGGAGPG